MKNNICPECGMPRIDCGNKGIMTINEIALKKKVERLQEQLKEANEVIENMKLCMDDKYDYDCVAEDVDIYLKKWGVK